MRILVTGGAGFIGSHTVELLLKHGHFVTVLDDFSTGRHENLAHLHPAHCANLLVFKMSITEAGRLDRIFDTLRPEAVLHLAAQSAITTAWKNPKKDARVNTIGTLNLLELANKYEVGKFVFSSTSAVYKSANTFFGMTEKYKTEPNTPYGISKLAAENYIRAMFDNHIILRYGNVYGERQYSIGENQVVARALDHFTTGTNFKVVGDGNQKRDFVHVSDIAAANVLALESEVCGTFNCATGTSVSVNQITKTISDSYAVRYHWEHTAENDPRGNVYLNCNLIRRKLLWQAEVGLEEGIRMTADWWKERA